MDVLSNLKIPRWVAFAILGRCWNFQPPQELFLDQHPVQVSTRPGHCRSGIGRSTSLGANRNEYR